MTRDELRAVVVASLQDLCGGDVEITDDTNPREDLNLDSEDGVEFACEVSERMGRLFPNELNPFVDDAKSCIRSVGAIVDLLEEIQSSMQPIEKPQ